MGNKTGTTKKTETESVEGVGQEPIATITPEAEQKPLGIDAKVLDVEGGEFDKLDPYHEKKPEPIDSCEEPCEPIKGLDLTDVKLAILEASMDLAGECQFRKVENIGKAYKFEVCFKSLKPMFGNQSGSRLVIKGLVIDTIDAVKIKRQLLVQTRGL
jgi:hypothetical protein